MAVQFPSRQCRDAWHYHACNCHIHLKPFSNFRSLKWIIKVLVTNRYVACLQMLRPETPSWNQFLLYCKVWSEIVLDHNNWSPVDERLYFMPCVCSYETKGACQHQLSWDKKTDIFSSLNKEKKKSIHFSFFATREIFLLSHSYFSISGFFPRL